MGMQNVFFSHGSVIVSKISTDRALHCTLPGTKLSSKVFNGLEARFLACSERNSAQEKKKVREVFFFFELVVLLVHSQS